MRSSRVSAVLAPLFVLTLFAPPLAAQGRPGIPLDQGLWGLAGTDPNLSQDDLEPLRQIIGGAQLVGLGESVHTSGGFYDLKHRVFRYLVEQVGFRAFAMETPWMGAERVAQYVQTCQGTPRNAIRGIFTVWQSTEVQALVQWMCEWNTAHPDDRVHFYGFDVQGQGFQSGIALIDFLHRLGLGDEDPRVAGIHVCDGVDMDYLFAGLPYPPELYQQCQGALADTAAFFDREEKAIERQTSEEDLGWARIHLVGQQAWQEQMFLFFTDPVGGGRARDRGMAYVVQAIRELRFPHARTVIWAHNGHLAKQTSATDYIAGVQMGTLLAEELKSKYAAIGLLARETYIDWRNVGCGLVDDYPTGPGTVEHLFHNFLDVGAGVGVLADLKHGKLLQPGATYILGGFSMVPLDQFDALLYLEVSPKMHPLAWPSCQ